MTESAARLVDAVLPRVPVRQWVLSLPHRLRYLLAWNHGLARALLGVYVRVLISFHRHRARRYGIRDSRSGSRSSRRASAAAQRGLGAREKALDVRLLTED